MALAHLVKLILMILVIQLLIEVCVSARVKSGTKDKADKARDSKKEGSSDKKDDDLDDIDSLSLDATLSCYKCSGENCTESSISEKTLKTQCATGEICWKGRSKSGFARGCASRQCIPSIDDRTSYANNMCCISDYCNESNRNVVPSLTHLLITVLVSKAITICLA